VRLAGINRWGRRGRHIEDLSDAEILALAISNEEQANRAYTDFAESLRTDYPDSARMFTEMAREETDHRHRLVKLFKEKFGETIPRIHAEDVRGIVQERPSGLAKFQGAEALRRQARHMEGKRELATTFPGSHVTPRLPIDTKGDGKNERGVVRGS
jgi:hypothetical protein